MIAGLVEPPSSGFDCGTSVALAAMGTCIVRPGGTPPRSNNFRVDQGQHSRVTVGVSVCLRCQDGCFSRLIIRGHAKGGRTVDWGEASGGKMKKQGTTGKASDFW